MSMIETKGIARGVYPINTGKVLIGCMYLPRRPQYATETELFWQGILLGRESVRPSISTSVTLASRRFVNLTRAIGAIFRRK